MYNFYLNEQVWGELDIIWTIIFIILIMFYVYLAYIIWTNQITNY